MSLKRFDYLCKHCNRKFVDVMLHKDIKHLCDKCDRETDRIERNENIRS